MLIVISPAKTLDFDSPLPPVRASQPRLLAQSQSLIDQARKLSASDVASLMKVSDKIAALNVARFASWHTPFNKDNARPALYAFMGDVYTGLEARAFSVEDVRYAQSHLRILSGLYGLLRPLDLIQPYRLEMGTRLRNSNGEDLYRFWGDDISTLLKKDMAAANSDVLVNLASQEYFRAVRPSVLGRRTVTPVFEDEKQGKFKIISFYAKKARGLMAAWILRERVDTVDGLSGFNVAGYRFVPSGSDADTLLFRRKEKDIPAT